MYEKISICMIIPIKHKSQRVPGKNYRDFNGYPLFDIILNKVVKVGYIDKVIIDTNSPTIKKLIEEKHNEKVIIYDRPEELCGHDVSTNTLLMNVIDKMNLNYDYYMQTHVTNPILSIDTIEKCIETFFKKTDHGFDSLFTVKQLQTRLYYKHNEQVQALNHNINELLQTQDLDPLFEENSCLYIFNKETLFKKKHRLGFNPYMFIMKDIESFDIDTEYDFLIAKTVDYNLKLSANSKKVVLVTGANGGIGQDICKKFKSMNWKVFGIDIVNNIDNQYVDEFIKLDLTTEGSFEKLSLIFERSDCKLHCIINNAAVQICKPVWELEENNWDKTYACNVKMPFMLIKNLLPFMKNNKASIINIGSVHATNTSDEISAYASSKAALVGLTKNLAIELSKFQIRVNSISPGAIETNMLKAGLLRNSDGILTEKELIDNLEKKHLLGKIGNPKNVAEFAYYITQNDFINGSNMIMDGGACIKLSTE